MVFVYVVDTSALVDASIRYPQDTFPNVWKRLSGIVTDGRLISPSEVPKELEKKDDDVLSWCKTNSRMFVDNNNEIVKLVDEVMSEFKQLVPVNSVNAVADPFVVALARVIQAQSIDDSTPAVITHESRRSDIKIPAACTRYNITDMTLLGMFSTEGWQF